MHNWIIGYAGPPGADPEIALSVVVLNNPETGDFTGGQVAGPIVKAMIEQAMAVLPTPPPATPPATVGPGGSSPRPAPTRDRRRHGRPAPAACDRHARRTDDGAHRRDLAPVATHHRRPDVAARPRSRRRSRRRPADPVPTDRPWPGAPVAVGCLRGPEGSTRLVPPMSDPGPTVFNDRYELHRKLARGGMADVYLARDRVLDRPGGGQGAVPRVRQGRRRSSSGSAVRPRPPPA